MSLFGRKKVQNTIRLSDDEAWRRALIATCGYYVSATTAIKVAAVLRCCDVVAKTMASLPLRLMRMDGNDRKPANDDPLYRILSRLPNPTTTAYEFWHMYVFSIMLTTGAFAKIKHDRAGNVMAIYNIPTARCSDVRINSVSGERYVIVTDDHDTETLREGEFMYTPGLRFSSVSNPEDPVSIASEVIGLSMALNAYARDYFENGTNAGGFVTHPDSMSDTAYERFKNSWQTTYAGVRNQHKVGFLEEGMKFEKLGADPETAQALESRKFAINEICRLFGVPPHKVYDLDRATFSNIEQQNIEYVQESITPMAVRIEQTIYKDCLPDWKRDAGYYAKFTVNALMRGDVAARTAYYHNARQDGWMSADDIRELEDMNLLPPGAGGDIYAVNGNMIPLTSIPQNLPKGAKS